MRGRAENTLVLDNHPICSVEPKLLSKMSCGEQRRAISVPPASTHIPVNAKRMNTPVDVQYWTPTVKQNSSRKFQFSFLCLIIKKKKHGFSIYHCFNCESRRRFLKITEFFFLPESMLSSVCNWGVTTGFHMQEENCLGHKHRFTELLKIAYISKRFLPDFQILAQL
jgi:hypothetical protein